MGEKIMKLDRKEYQQYVSELFAYNNKWYGDHFSRQYAKPTLKYEDWVEERKKRRV